MSRVLAITGPGNIGQQGLLRAAEAAGPALGVRVVPTVASSVSEFELAIDAFAKEPNGGLIGLPGNPSLDSSDLIIALAARHRLPAMYTHRLSGRRPDVLRHRHSRPLSTRRPLCGSHS